MNNYKERYILALDQGTTSSRAILFDKNANIVDQHNIEIKQIYPKSGWVEHDPNEIYSSILQAAVTIIARNDIRPEQINSIGITNQRETTVVWDKATGQPIYNAIVWQCRRTADYCAEIRAKFPKFVSLIYDKTGLILDPYFSATKIRYILDNVPGAKARAKKGQLCFGTIDSWLVYKLTDGLHHKTDFTNASRTMLFNIHTLQWDKELLEFFQIPEAMMPEVVPNSCHDIYTAEKVFGGRQIPISGIIGDQQSALFGQCCFKKGDIKNTYGTGCFLLMNTGDSPKHSKNNLLTTIAWNIDGQVTYALEGSVFIGGAVIQWLRDSLNVINNSSQTEEICLNNNKKSGLIFVPAFSGLGTPYWDSDARGAILGMTRDTDRADIIKAGLDAVAFQSLDLINAMKNDLSQNNEKVKICLRADGGASKNNYLMQRQADLIQDDLFVSKMTENTGLGAAYMAGLATGFFPNTDYIERLNKEMKRFRPKIQKEIAVADYSRWQKAIQAIRMFK